MKKRPEPTNAGLGLGQNFPKPKKTQPDPNIIHKQLGFTQLIQIQPDPNLMLPWSWKYT